LNSQGESPIVAVVETHSIVTLDDHPVVADIYPAGGDRVVVMCHGFKGHRRWGFIPRVAESLRDAGITAVAMDFSLNGRIAPGATEPEGGFPDPEAFRRNTVARERDDLRRAIDWARKHFPPGITVGLWGHSRGGVAAMLAALDDPSIPALVTWSTAAHPDFYTAAQKARWREAGAMDFTDADSKTALSIDVAYLDDLETHAREYALADRAGDLAAAHLIVHGEHDLVIPVADAERLAGAPRQADKELLRLPTGHTFGYEGGGDALERATEATVEWCRERLPSPESS
jgi:pimeloyl-ACP methyl ester carboxylesterase